LCDPTAIAIGSLVLGVAGTAGKAKAQNKAAKAEEKAIESNKQSALLAYRESSKDISLLEQQTQDQTNRTIQETDRAARATKALARVSAGEAGVSGISVEALLGDIDRRAGEFRTTSARNLDMVIDSLQREKASGRTIAQGRISSVQPQIAQANPFAIGLEIAGQGLSFWQGQIPRSPTSS
jgi:hypothetical protein